jgi:hypothetical protein
MVTAIAAVLALSLQAPIELKGESVGPYLEFNVKINQKPAKLILDSGAGMNVLTPEAAERLGIRGGTEVNAQGVGSQAVKARIVALEHFQLGHTELATSQAVVIPLPAMLQSDGLIGHGVLSRYVAEIDYDAKTLRLHPRDGYRPAADLKSVELRVKSNIPEIKMEIGGHDTWVKLDTGATDSVTLFKPFVDQYDIRSKVTNLIAGGQSLGVGGGQASEMGFLKGMKLAGFELPELQVSLSKAQQGVFADSATQGNLGAEILYRFTVLLDYAGGKAYFKPGKQFNAIQRINRTGISTLFDGQKHPVLAVRPNSPAAKARMQVGEEIMSVNNVSVSKLKAFDIWNAFRQPAGTKLQLGIKRLDGAERRVDLVLEDPKP